MISLDTPEAVRTDPDANLKTNSLGSFGIFFLIVSAAAPLSVAAGIGPLAILIGGIGAPIVYLLAGVVLIVFAIPFMAMARHVSTLGGFYTYITASLGKVVGLGSAAVAMLSYNALQIGLYGLMGVQVEGLLKTLLGIDVPWWLIAYVGIALVFLLAYLGIDVGAKVLGILLVAETLVLSLLVVAVVVHGGAHGLSLGFLKPGNLFTPGMFAIIGFGFAAFMGFESSVLYREEAKSPDRVIPRATYGAVIFMAVFYALVLWAVVQAFGDAQVQAVAAKDPAGLFFTAMRLYVGPWAEVVMYLLIVTSIYAGQLAFHHAINRYTFSLARDGILPRALHTTSRFGSPWVAGLVQTVLATIVVTVFVLAHGDPYQQLVLWVNSPGVLGVIALQALTGVAVIVFFVRRRDVPRRWYIIPAAVVGTLAMVGLLVLLISTIDTLTAGGPVVDTVIVLLLPVVFIVGAVTAVVLKRRRPEAYERIAGGE